MEAPQFLAWTGHTDAGRVRSNNEDSFLCLEIDDCEARILGKVGQVSLGRHDHLFAVSDGMGGAMAGEFASRIAVEKITRIMPEAFRRARAGLALGHAGVLDRLYAEIHRALVYLGASYEECSGMGTTLTLGWITAGHLHFAHIGDSRIYHLPADPSRRLEQLSDDDTHVGWLFRNGKINERQARSHPGRNSLQRALGANNQFINPQTGSVSLASGDRFLLCTDGLTEGLYDDHINSLIRNPDKHEASEIPAHRLVQASLARSGRDNTTAIVLEFQ